MSFSAWISAHYEEQGPVRWLALKISSRKSLVDRDLREPWSDEGESRGGDEDSDGRCHVPPIGAQIGQEPPHEARVVRLAQRFFFVDGPFRRCLQGRFSDGRGSGPPNIPAMRVAFHPGSLTLPRLGFIIAAC